MCKTMCKHLRPSCVRRAKCPLYYYYEKSQFCKGSLEGVNPRSLQREAEFFARCAYWTFFLNVMEWSGQRTGHRQRSQ